MKILLVHPGASFATHDVWVGLRDGLIALGNEIIDYRLDQRIDLAGSWFNRMWVRAGKPKNKRPTPGDVLYKAASDVLTWALRHEVDWVLIVSGMYFHPDYFVLLKRAGLRVGMICTESPYDDEKQIKVRPFCDLCWTSEKTSVEPLDAIYLPHGFNPARHKPGAQKIDKHVKSHDVVFVGTGFRERLELLQAVDWTGIDLGLYGSWTLMGSRSKLRRYLLSEEIDNEMTAALYRKAKIGLNIYRKSMGFGWKAPRIENAESLNPRAYELAATGCFYLSEYRKEHDQIFGGLVPTFATAKELEALIRRWLAENKARKHAARLLPERVKKHSWLERAKIVHNALHDKEAMKWRSTQEKKERFISRPAERATRRQFSA